MRITILGNGDAMGTPRVYCECEVCGEARTGGRNKRLRSSAWLEAEGELPLLLDCGPDWRSQMEKRGVRRVGRGLLTHAHFDHIGGLAEWADACRWLGGPAEVYAPAEVLAEVRVRFPWLERQLAMQANDAGMTYGEWFVRPWRVNHGKNGYAYAYRFERARDGCAWAYCSDSIALTEEQKRPLRGVRLLVLGTSFYEEPFPMETRSVYDVKEGLLLASEVGAGETILTHLSHDIDARRDYGLPSGIRFAEEGLTVEL